MFQQTIENEMVLIKFVVNFDDGSGNTLPIGALNWHAIHPTNRGQTNTFITGDNKGWASQRFESEMLAGVGDETLDATPAFLRGADANGAPRRLAYDRADRISSHVR